MTDSLADKINTAEPQAANIVGTGALIGLWIAPDQRLHAATAAGAIRLFCWQTRRR